MIHGRMRLLFILTPGWHLARVHTRQLPCVYLEPSSTFLDVGTGSGILMIVAAKLGARRITGIDTDEVAIKVARQNLAKNNIKTGLFELLCTTLDKTDRAPYNFIAANIIAQVIVDILPAISIRMTPDTTTVLSGIIKERQSQVLAALEANHLFVIHEEYMDEWVTLAVKKK